MFTTFAELVKSYREKRYLSREDLSRKTGKSAQSIKDIEDGRTTSPQPDTIRKIATALDIEDDVLWKVAELTRQQKQQKKSEPLFPLPKNSNSAKLKNNNSQNSFKTKNLPVAEIVLPITEEEGEVKIINLQNEIIGGLKVSITTCSKTDLFVKFVGDTLRCFCIENGMLLGIKYNAECSPEDLIAVKSNEKKIEIIQLKNRVNEEILGKVVIKTTDLREI